MATSGLVNIFEYLDYRAYLRDFYAQQKGKSAAFSHRAFSRRAGLRSSNYLSLIMKGERDLSSEMAPRFAKACGLAKGEADFFCDLAEQECFDRRVGRGLQDDRAAHRHRRNDLADIQEEWNVIRRNRDHDT